MKEDINYYNYHVGEGRDEYQPNNELTWNAYIEDRNANASSKVALKLIKLVK
jgi:hypothetical protein